MNLYEILRTELDEKAYNWKILDKLNYVYLRSLQILSYDSRWEYTNNQLLRNELFDKEVNIFNLDDTRVICSSWARLYTDLVSCLFSEKEGFDVTFTEGTRDPHMYSRVFLMDGSTIDYDPLTKTNDFVRAKTNLPLKGIRINNNQSKWSNEIDIEESFKKIGYEIDDVGFLKNLKHVLLQKNVSSKEVLDALLKDIDYEKLDLIELNTFLNMQYKKYTGTPLDVLGIKFKPNEESIVIIKINDEDIYQEEEVNQKVNIRKI